VHTFEEMDITNIRKKKIHAEKAHELRKNREGTKVEKEKERFWQGTTLQGLPQSTG
jgi:hypothetical protein